MRAGALGMLEWFQAAFPGRGGEREQPQAAAGSVWELGEQAMPEAGAARVGRQAGMQDLSRMDGGRTEPARLCRREMAARLDLEMNPSSPRPPIPGLAAPAYFSAPAAIPLRGTALLLAPRQSRSHGPTATPTSPQPCPHGQRDTICLWCGHISAACPHRPAELGARGPQGQ